MAKSKQMFLVSGCYVVFVKREIVIQSGTISLGTNVKIIWFGSRQNDNTKNK